MCADIPPIAVTHVHGDDGSARKAAILELCHGPSDGIPKGSHLLFRLNPGV